MKKKKESFFFWNFQFLLGIQIASIYFHGFKNIHKTRKQEGKFFVD